MELPSILLVGCDEHLSRIYMKRFLGDGWSVDVASNWQSGEQKAAKSQPNVVVLDDSCSVNIIEEVRRMKRLPTLLKTKIVLLVKNGQLQQIQEAISAGVSMYLIEKHFTPMELVKKMKTLTD